MFISNHNISTNADGGSDSMVGCYAIRVSSSTYTLVQLNNNNIYNTQYGIFVSSSGSGGGNAGYVYTNSNTLSCCLSSDTLGSRFMNVAITVQEPSAKPSETGEIVIDSNIISGAFCGINVNGYETVPSVVRNNYITLAKGSSGNCSRNTVSAFGKPIDCGIVW